MEYEEALGGIRKPVLILVGERDRTTTPRAAREMHDSLPGSELVIFPQAGHMTYIEQPQPYFAAVRDFVARHPVRDRA
jgi:pimeloyl-ACP methyl ester carboxylesterase